MVRSAKLIISVGLMCLAVSVLQVRGLGAMGDMVSLKELEPRFCSEGTEPAGILALSTMLEFGIAGHIPWRCSRTVERWH